MILQIFLVLSIGTYMYKSDESQSFQEAADAVQLRKEEEEFALEQERIEKMKEEKKKLKEEEAQKQKVLYFDFELLCGKYRKSAR